MLVYWQYVSHPQTETERVVVKFFRFGVVRFGVFLAACGALLGVARAGETVTETRPIDARVVRVKLDGVVDVRIRQGAQAALVLRGDPRWVERTSTVQSGDTLNIDTETRNVKLGQLRGLHAELVLPQLRAVWSETVGATEVSGFDGDELDLTLEGAGSMKVAGNYRNVTANLGGIGSIHLSGLNSDSIELNLRGAGVVTLIGRGRSLRADLGGLGGLDAKQFAVDNVQLDLSGLGNATVNVHQSVNLSLSGMGSVTVYGKPLNRKVAIDGLGKVSWK